VCLAIKFSPCLHKRDKQSVSVLGAFFLFVCPDDLFGYSIQRPF
jgi:hypothetical protein